MKRNPTPFAPAIEMMESEGRSDQYLQATDGCFWTVPAPKQSFVRPDRVAVAGNSFGGIETVLGAEHGGYCAAIDSAGGAQSWAEAPELQSVMTRAVRQSETPIFFFQAANDYDLSPSKTLSAAMKDVGKPDELKIYRPMASPYKTADTFGYFGSSVWAEDVFRFLGHHCIK